MDVIEVRPCGAADLEVAWRLRCLAFGSADQEPTWTEPDRAWQGWIAELDGLACGFARWWPFQQFFGGAAVPMGGLASVAVDPHARGHGVASAILAAALPDLRAAGRPISALYPSVVGLYRGLGWERVGTCEWVQVPTAELLTVPHPVRPVRLRPAGHADLAGLHDCYRRVAGTVDGMLDRAGPPFEPSMLLDLDVVTVVDGPPADGSPGPRGYLAAARSGAELVCYDLVATDADAEQALLRSVASWAGQLATVRLRLIGSRLLSAAGLGVHLEAEPWMLRVVDFPAAVAARGWPQAGLLRAGLAVGVELADRHAPWQAGRHRLVVDGGRVLVEPGAGDGAVRLTARGLSAWYAGAADTAALRRAGLLSGDPGAAAVLDALTGAPRQVRMANGF